MGSIAGIGSRDWDFDQLEAITNVSNSLSRKYEYLHSGNANGSDYAFALGFPQDKVILHLPWSGYNRENIHPENLLTIDGFPYQAKAREIWDKYREEGNRPYWDNLKPSIRNLMGRNYGIIHTVEEVYAAPKIENGKYAGGTWFGIMIAKELKIPVNILDVKNRYIEMNVFHVEKEFK